MQVVLGNVVPAWEVAFQSQLHTLEGLCKCVLGIWHLYHRRGCSFADEPRFGQTENSLEVTQLIKLE